MAGRWVDVGEAARELDISTDAVRKRISRGSLLSERMDGSVRVWLDDGGTEAGREAQVDREALIEAKDLAIRILEDQLREEREARRRADTIIAQLTQANAALAQRVPELEAPRRSSSPVRPEPGAPAGSSEPERGSPDREEGAPESAKPERVEPEGEEPERGEPRRTGNGGPREDAQRPWWKRMFGG